MFFFPSLVRLPGCWNNVTRDRAFKPLADPHNEFLNGQEVRGRKLRWGAIPEILLLRVPLAIRSHFPTTPIAVGMLRWNLNSVPHPDGYIGREKSKIRTATIIQPHL